jgi:hypothetical protein
MGRPAAQALPLRPFVLLSANGRFGLSSSERRATHRPAVRRNRSSYPFLSALRIEDA